MTINHGNEEGATCHRAGCQGTIEWSDVVDCSCHISPPCNYCTSRYLCCSECDWEEDLTEVNDQSHLTSTRSPWESYAAEQIRLSNLPLDRSTINWRSYPHSSCSMIKRGVYPDGETRASVYEKVQGTFGGQFVQFGNGTFEFIAYTD